MELDLSQARQTFIIESLEMLQAIEDALLRLEKSPDDHDTINSLFRSAHTIKGSSGIVGMDRVEKFTHSVESLLSKVRDGHLTITVEVIELLLDCKDHIALLIDVSAKDEGELPVDASAKENNLVEKLSALLGTGHEKARGKGCESEENEGRPAQTDAWHISIRFGANVLREGMDPLGFVNYLSKMGEITALHALFDSMPGTGEMDPETCYLGLEMDFRSDFSKKDIENVFEFVREDSAIHILPPHSTVDSYIELIRNLPEDTTLLGEILIKGGALTRAELDEALSYQSGREPEGGQPSGRQKIGEILVSKGMVHPEVLDAALEKQKKTNESRSREASTVRIDAAKLDDLVNLVGELVISSANMGQHATRLRDGSLHESASVMARLVEEIRDATMRIRMVPIGETFSRFNRVVRDINRDLGKEIELVINGGDTELDKTVVEKIADPLMHIVRNAADHGIERPDARLSAGKAAAGTIRLNAFHDAGCIVIEVNDDGRGLDRTKILEKAVSRGLAGTNHQLTESEILSLVFEPGFSTADQVTKLSGRGVGMDVVKKNIEALRGTVEVESKAGEGTTVRIRLPLTLAIIDGFMVGVDDSFYVIPLDMVVECVELSKTNRSAADKRSYINLRGEVLPYIRLRDFFGEAGVSGEFENVVIVRYAGQKIGLVVDELYGEVQTVIKSLGKMYKDVSGISGATIMGNGKVALIVDVPRLLLCAEPGAAA